MSNFSSPKLITVTGVVTPVEWDAHDNVTAVLIGDGDGSDYAVTARPALRKLLRHLDDVVEVTGVLSEDEYGNPVFDPEEVRSPGSYSPDDEDDDEEEEEEEEDWEEDDDWGGGGNGDDDWDWGEDDRN